MAEPAAPQWPGMRILEDAPSAWPGKPLEPLPGVGEDVAKTALPSTARGLTALMTSIPTVADLAGRGVGYGLNKYLPESKITGAANVLGDMWKESGLDKLTYPKLMPEIEDKITGPLYTAKTPMGKIAEKAIEFAPSALLSSPRALLTPSSIARGATAGAGSEAAGQLAEAYSPDKATPARIAGALLGGLAPSVARRAVTPLPASPERRAAYNLLREEAPNMEITAGQRTGSPLLQKIEGANSKSVGTPGRVRELEDTQNREFTQATLRHAGSNARSASPENLNAAAEDLSAQYQAIIPGAMIAPPHFANFQTQANAHRNTLLRAAGHGNTESIDNYITEIFGRGPRSTVVGMTGPRYQNMRQRMATSIDNASTSDERLALTGLRRSLDEAMENSMAPETAEHLRRLNQQTANSGIVRNAQITPEGTIPPSNLKSAIISRQGQEAYNRDRGTLPALARAGETVLQPLKEPPPAHNFISSALGALTAGAGGYAADGLRGGAEAFLPGLFAPHYILNALRQNPATAKTVFSRPVQGYLGNQVWQPSPSTAANTSEIVRLLGSTPMVPQQMSK